MSAIESIGDGILERFDAAVQEMRAPPPRRTVEAIRAEKVRWVKRLLAREMEGIALYEPLPLGERFHACNAQWRLLDGSNRAGKTLTASAEDAYAMTGTHPHKAYPEKNGYALFVGLERKHLALMYRTLFLPGAFSIIPDEHTGIYRTVRWDRNNPLRLQEYDEAYREKWKEAPPLIPPRMVAHIQFDIPEVPRTIRITNEWHSLWQSAAGKADQGAHYNHAHFDEENSDPEFYKEAHRGLTRREETVAQRPKGIWSATSQVANVELADLRDKADADPESDSARRFVFLIDDCPYFPADAKKEFYDGLSDDDRLTRYHGIPSGQRRRIYDYKPMGDSEYGTGHGCDAFEIDPSVDCRYVIIDPGVNHCALLFISIDPLEKYMTVYDGIELGDANARLAAAAIKERQGDWMFEAVMIDEQMASQRQNVRETTTVGIEYRKAMEEMGVQVRRRGSLEGFLPGLRDIYARQLALVSTMEIRGSGPFEGTCKLRVMRGIRPELDKQIRRAQTDPKNPLKRYKNPKIPCDFLDDLEYAAAGKLTYHYPVPLIAVDTDNIPSVVDILNERRRVQKQRELARVSSY